MPLHSETDQTEVLLDSELTLLEHDDERAAVCSAHRRDTYVVGGNVSVHVVSTHPHGRVRSYNPMAVFCSLNQLIPLQHNRTLPC